MCPLCVANIGILLTGLISSSAVGAFTFTKIFRQTTANKGNSKRRKCERAHETRRQER